MKPEINSKFKKGSHVGIVVSFVIFLVFITLLYILLQPSINSNTKKGFAEYLEARVINKTSENLKKISVKITSLSPLDCVKLAGFLSAAEVGIHLKVVDGTSESVTSNVDGNDLFIERNSNLFFKVSESSEFDASSSGGITPCQTINEGSSGYDIGLIKTSSYVFESKIIDLIDEYAADYSSLRDEFNLASGDEFGVSLIYNNGTEISTNGAEVPLSVYIKKTPVQYINSKGGIESGSLIIKIW